MKRALENLRLSFQTQLSYLQTVEVTRHLRTLWFFLSLCLLLSARPASAAVTLLFEGGNAIISWPLTATGFILQQTENLGANAVWTPVSHSVAQTPDEYVVTVPATKPKQFFRLVPYSTGALSYHRIDIDSPNPQAGAGFGSTVAVIGDVNGDGVPDFAVGAPGQTVGGISGAGAVFVFSGADHAFIREIDNPAPALGGCFGAAISVFSGTNIVLGAPGQDRAYVVDPATGALVNSLAPSGLSPGKHFGFAVSGLFVTAPDASVNGQGESGALFYCKPNPTLVTNGGAFDRMGMAVAVGGFGYL